MSHSGKTESLFGQSSNRLNQQNLHISADLKGHSDGPLLREKRPPAFIDAGGVWAWATPEGAEAMKEWRGRV